MTGTNARITEEGSKGKTHIMIFLPPSDDEWRTSLTGKLIGMHSCVLQHAYVSVYMCYHKARRLLKGLGRRMSDQRWVCVRVLYRFCVCAVCIVFNCVWEEFNVPDACVRIRVLWLCVCVCIRVEVSRKSVSNLHERTTSEKIINNTIIILKRWVCEEGLAIREICYRTVMHRAYNFDRDIPTYV